MQDQGLNSQTKRKANNAGSDTSSTHSDDLLSEDELTMLFFVPEFIVTEDLKHFLRIHLDPMDWNYQGLGVCSYTNNGGQEHPHVISFTTKHSTIEKLEIQLVDVSSIYTHEFTFVIVEPDDQAITPKPINDSLERWAKQETIRCLKGTCPKNGKALAFFAQAFKTGTTVFGITQEIMLFLQNIEPPPPEAPAKSA